MAYADVSDQDLVSRMFDTERKLVAARFKHSTNQLENTSTLRNLRREIARLKTEARVRETAQGLMPNALIASHRPTGTATDAPAEESTKGGFLQGIVDKISGND